MMALGFVLGWLARLLIERWRRWENRGVDLETVLSIRDGRASIWPLPPQSSDDLGWNVMGFEPRIQPPDPRTTNLRDYAERWSGDSGDAA